MSKCLRCGYCCIKCPCIYAQFLHQFLSRSEICPYLKWEHTRYTCRLYKTIEERVDKMTKEGILDKTSRELIEGIFDGKCENPKNSWKKNIKLYERRKS